MNSHIRNKIELLEISSWGNKFRQYPLHTIIEKGDEELLAYYLSIDNEMDDTDDNGPPLPLGVGVYTEHRQYTGCINGINFCCATPLQHAIKHHRYKMVEMLLNHPSVVINSPNIIFMAFGFSILYGTIDIAKLIMLYSPPDQNNLNRTLHFLCWMDVNDKFNKITYLISLGANINTAHMYDDTVHTPILHDVASRDDHALLMLLVENGANIDIVDNDNNTTLHIASVSQGNFDMIKYLLDCGADRTIKNNDGLTAEDYATSVGYRNTASYIRDYVEIPDIKEPCDP